MGLKPFTYILIIGGVLCLGNQSSLAQSKTIGEPTGGTLTPSLVVINASAAKLDGTKLILSGVQKSSIIFADRPERAAGHVLTSDFVKSWDKGNDDFAKDPPNATVSVLGSAANENKDVVVELTSAKLEGNTLTFDVKILEGTIAGADGPAAVFIDHWGYRWHGGAAFVAGVAVGAAVANRPYYPPPYYPPYRCGYYPYPPCY